MNTSKTVVGVDIAKRVFQLHWVERETGEIVNVQLKRGGFLEHFASRAPCLIGMEACGGSQHWARELQGLGHVVKLLPGRVVKSFVGGNKSDVHDARAIWTAVQQPGIKTVAIKSEEQQAVLALHRMRQQLVKFRTAQINGLRGLLAEYGEVMPQGKAGVKKGIVEALQRLADRLPAMVIDTLREQWERIGELDEQISEIERRIKPGTKKTRLANALKTSPGSACSPPRRRWRRWARPKRSPQDASLQPGWGLCLGKRVLAGECGCWGLASAVTRTCARYLFTGHARCCRTPKNRSRGSPICADADH